MRINRLKPITWDVEEHLGGRKGIGKGVRTGSYESEDAAVRAMIACYAEDHTATVIVRNRRGEGIMLVLGLVIP